MRSSLRARAAALALMSAAAVTTTGCPELNRQPDRSANPLFSVADPAEPGCTVQPDAKPAGTFGNANIVISEQGGLSDLARRAE
ncbi:MAG TPA: hypothetical protein VKU82_14720 [Planctomycetaceae bacterium]|nr:hypothetical protein [Planctomycetaceae bacterium]